MHFLVNHACIKERKRVSTYHGKADKRDGITIGNDVWIGQNVVLLGAITIGDGAIIGAFSVVAKDIPPYAVVVGNPAVIKRFRFSEDQISKLLKIQWWQWDEKKIEENIQDLLDIDVFLRKHYD